MSNPVSGSASQKILSVGQLAEKVEQAKKEGKTVVQSHGVFDLLHPGHIRHFEAAKREGDMLVVTITPDQYVNKGPGRPVFTAELRAESVAALGVVDYVAINEWPTAVEVIRAIKPSVYIKGSDYRNAADDITGKITEEEQAVQSVGGRIHFTDELTSSSSKLINQHLDVFTQEQRSFLDAFRAHASDKDVLSQLNDLKDMRVLVIGDAIIDEYCTCKALGMASKSATINARFMESEQYPGGALAVANHIAGFCNDVHLVSVAGGQDSHLSFMESHLKPGVSTKFFVRDDAPTTRKRRYMDPFRFQKMFEVTHLNDDPISSELEASLCAHLRESLPLYDLVVVADFGHGMIGPAVAKTIEDGAKFLALNVQTNSANMGFNRLTKYSRADYLCIDERELRLAYHDRFGDINALVNKAFIDFGASVVTVTLGQKGSLVKTATDTALVPAFASDVIDTIGAGDAFLSLTAPLAARGADANVIGLVGNAAGAIAAQILGNKESVEPVTLQKFLTTLLK